MNNLLEVIENERWDHHSIDDMMSQYQWDTDRSDHNDGLDRIAEAAKQPCVMKRWTDDCKPKPEPNKYFWGSTGCNEIANYNNAGIKRNTDKYTHWLELEHTNFTGSANDPCDRCGIEYSKYVSMC
jgi:hypothetical protein